MMGAALVTGAARRIGRALALEAAACGYAVAVHHRDGADDAQSLVSEITSAGGKAAAVGGDLSDIGALPGLIDQAHQALGPVSLLVNNASVFHADRFADASPHWEEHFAVNLRAPVMLAQAFAKALPANLDGLIVNILDQRVWRPNPQFFSYTLSKAALWTATQTMAQDLGPRIRVNGIGPGPTLPSVHQSPADFETEVRGVILQKKVSPADIAGALRYLIGATSVTGQMIAVD
ncbi:MAG TPA: SDR family oxidoreductase, partial [Caulobacteraceae bacterium]|nr:SDR family oxidoreductase [Caulobacteraceae bacterium]